MNQPAAGVDRCYRHPDREAYISCQRCGRRICPDCMRDASVGFHCPECVSEGAKTVRQPRNFAGGRITGREGVVSLTIIGINVAAFLLMYATGNQSSEIFQQGAMRGLEVFDGQYWRLFTAGFVHSGILHIALNMYALYLFGPFVEQALGIRRFIASYVTMLIVSSVFVYVLTNPLVATVGASGAIFGLFGLALMLLIRAKQDVRMLLVLLVINAVISMQGGISWQGHLGGFLCGIVLGWVFAYAPRALRVRWQWATFAALWIGIFVAIALRTADLNSLVFYAPM